MANINTVNLTAGVPTGPAGAATVSTIDALMAQLAAGPTPVSGTITANQGGAPWAVTISSGSVTIASGTVAVSGSVAVTQSGTWTFQPGNTANTTPWLVKISDGSNSPTIKSAAPVSGDLGMVVQLHPNSLNTNGPKTAVNSAPVALPTDAATISIAFDTTQLMNGVSGAGLTPTKGKITATTAGTYTMVPLQAGKKIRLLSMYLNSTLANTINLRSQVTTTNNDGHPAYSATGGMVLPFNPIGWFDTTVGEALEMIVGANGEVSGQFSWIAV